MSALAFYPTRIGNCVRAFEVYPWVLYGMEASYLWPRMYPILPETLRQVISGHKSRFDFFLNLLFLAILYIAAVVVVLVGVGDKTDEEFLTCIIALAVSATTALGAYRGLGSTLPGWGQAVRSAFDLYRSDLAHQLGFELPNEPAQERVFWQLISQAITYRSSEALDKTSIYRKQGGPPVSTGEPRVQSRSVPY